MISSTISFFILTILFVNLCTGCIESELKRGEDFGSVIGIDLGTTYACVGVYEKGRVEIIANDQGNRVTPSWVAFTETEVLIGEEAKKQAALNPQNTVFGAKRLIGRIWSDPEVQREQKLFPFKLVPKEGKPYIQVQYLGETKVFSPEEISAMILRKMKQTAEDYLGKRVTHAVVTVPAYFNDAQRYATQVAGRIAGLKVLRVVNEPTAAAIAYGLEDTPDEKRILVFDLGDATFDVSLLIADSGVFEVVATSTDPHFGGEDFDHRVMKYMFKQFESKTNKDASNDQRSIRILKREVERAKRILTSAHSTRIEIENFFDGQDFVEIFTRAKFEDLNLDLFKKIIGPVQKVIDDYELKKHEIDEIVLVGGSSRIPKVQELLKNFFDGKEPNRGINPEEVAAYGAAVQGGILSNEGPTDPFSCILCDLVPLTFGIETVGGVMSSLIPRNSPVPTRKSQIFSTSQDNQDRVVIQVFVGERSMTKDNLLLGKFELSGIPPAPRGVPQIEVTFEIDVNGNLNIAAEDKGKRESLTITNDMSRLSQDDFIRMVQEAELYAEQDQKMKETISSRNQLENYAYTVRNSISDEQKFGHKLGSEDKETIETAVKETIRWFEENSMTASKEEYGKKYHELEEVVRPIFTKSSGEGADAFPGLPSGLLDAGFPRGGLLGFGSDSRTTVHTEL